MFGSVDVEEVVGREGEDEEAILESAGLEEERFEEDDDGWGWRCICERVEEIDDWS
jgi:hypothetical protein